MLIAVIALGFLSLIGISIYLDYGLKSLTVLRSIFRKTLDKKFNLEDVDPIVWLGFERGRRKEFDVKIRFSDRLLHLLLPMLFFAFWIFIIIVKFAGISEVLL